MNRNTITAMYLCTIIYGFIPYILFETFVGIPKVSFINQSINIQYATLLVFCFLAFACYRVIRLAHSDRFPRKISGCIKLAIIAPFSRYH